MRSAPGSKTDPTMAKLAAFRDKLAADEAVRPAKPKPTLTPQDMRRLARLRREHLVNNPNVEQGATRPGERPKINSGSIQAAPTKKRPSRSSGVTQKVMRDFVPARPDDWTSRSRMSATAPAGSGVTRPHWSLFIANRDPLSNERAGKDVHTSAEQRQMSANRPSGVLRSQTHAERHDDDRQAGVYRDELGRVMRTEDMPDCEVRLVTETVMVKNRFGIPVPQEHSDLRRVSGVTPREHATGRGLPGVRTKSDMRDERIDVRNAEKKIRKMMREEERERKAAAKAAAKAARAAEREQESAERQAKAAERDKLRSMAKAVLMARGVAQPTRQQISLQLDVFEADRQRMEYTQGHVTRDNMRKAA